MAQVAFPALHKALKRAFKAHKKQDRDGDHPLPYITHPVEVVNILRYEAGVTDEEILCAAALHDTVEESDDDPDELLEEIEEDFGPRVARIVREVTREEPDRTGLSDEEVWQLRTYLMLEEIDRMSDESKKLKLADRLSNVRNALVTRDEASLFKYIRQTLLILEHIDQGICPPLWDKVAELARSVKLPPQYTQLVPAPPAESAQASSSS